MKIFEVTLKVRNSKTYVREGDYKNTCTAVDAADAINQTLEKASNLYAVMGGEKHVYGVKSCFEQGEYKSLAY